MNKQFLVLIALCVVVLIGYFSISGFYLKTADDITAEKIMESSRLWLSTDDGRTSFPDVVVDNPMPVYIQNTYEILYWYVPVKNKEGLYVGLLKTDREEFEMPNGILRYPNPVEKIFVNKEKGDVYLFIIENFNYSAGQISKPRLVAQNGLFWLSEIMQNGEIIDEIYVETSETSTV